MRILQRIRSKVREWLGGSSKKAPPSPRGKRYTNNRYTKATPTYRGGRFYSSDEEYEKKKKQDEKIKKAFKAEKKETKSTATTNRGVQIANDMKKTSYEKRKKAFEHGQELANKGIEKAKEKSVIERKKQLDDKKETTRKRLDAIKEKNKKQSEDLIVRDENGKKVGVKIHGTHYTDMDYRMKKNRKAYSFTRGAVSGLTLGASELAAKKIADNNEDYAKAEKTYQKKKSKGWEMAGEVAGSLATFGGAEGATRVVGEKAVAKGAKVAGKVAPKATKAVVKKVGKDRLKRVATTLASETVQNATTGALYDLNKATAKHKIGSEEWKKEMADNAKFNLGITGVIGAGSYIKGSRQAAKEAKSALEALGESKSSKNYLRGKLKNEKMVVRRGGEVAEEAADKVRRYEDIDLSAGHTEEEREILRQRRNAISAEANRLDVTAKTDAEKARVQQLRGEVSRIDSALSRDVGEPARFADVGAKNEEQLNLVDETADASTKDPLSTYKRKRLKENPDAVFDESRLTANEHNEQIALDDEIKKSEKPESNSQTSLDEAIEKSEQNPASKATKEKPPKTAKEKKKAEAAERAYLDTVARKGEKSLDESIRSQTKGEYGYRQGEHTAAAHSSLEHAKRMDARRREVGKTLRDNGVAELFENEDNTFGILKTANKAELDKAAGEAVKRVNDDLHGTVKRLRELDERLVADVRKNSALASAEHITLNDVADIVAIRKLFDEAGETLPKEYEEAFAHIIEWQRTEASQGLKAIDLFLKENDEAYRRAFLTRDVDRYMRKVLHADDVDIADIKRSLDANHGDGYFDNMIKELSKYTGAKNEAAFRKAYADFQAEIFMNTKPSVWDAINLWRHSFMLSSPKTGANNIIGNVMQRVMYRISDAVNIAGESIAQGINPEVKRTTALLKNSDQRKLARMYTSGRRGKLNLKNENYLKGFDDQAFADEINMVSDADVAEMMESSKYMGDIVKGLKYKPTTAGGKVKQGLIKGGRWGNEYVSLMLNEPDSWFVERNYRSALLKYLEANGVNGSKTLNTKEGAELLKEARAYAKDVALENTYKKANSVVSFLEGLRTKGHTKGSGLGYKVGSIILDAELPYLKVPANLIINNFKYSPAGLAKGAVDAFRGITKGDAELLNKATRELSKGLTGTGMAMLGYMMFCRDQTDEDSWGFIANARDELKEYGVRDNSFKIGDHNFNIANMGIGSVQFLMGASLAEDLAEKGATAPYQVVFDALNKTIDTVADMSLMENAVSLLDTFGNGGDYDTTVSERLGRAGTEIAGDYAAQFIPNPMRGVAKGMTSADLDTGVNKGDDTTQIQRILERNRNNFVQGVPIANEKILPHKVDTHGNLVNERTTNREKLSAVLNNTLNPLSANKVHIPEADKEELKVIKENGKPFKPNGFDKDRKYEAKVGKGKYAEYVDLTGKEREQVARAAKQSGYDLTDALVRKGMFGDRLGNRAQKILANAPDDEEKAREAIFATPEWKNADNETKEKWLEIMYGQGTKGDGSRGVSRARNREAYVEIQGNSDGDFRYQNDLDWHYQKKYEENGYADLGIDKGTYADVVQAVYDYSHKWDEERGNVDTPNSAKKVKAALLAVKGLTTEQRIALYQGYRGKRNGFGWYDWDGVSGGSGYRRYGRGYHHYRRGGGGSRKAPALKKSAFKAQKMDYTRDLTTPRTQTSRNSTQSIVKIEPPKVKFKKYEV